MVNHNLNPDQQHLLQMERNALLWIGLKWCDIFSNKNNNNVLWATFATQWQILKKIFLDVCLYFQHPDCWCICSLDHWLAQHGWILGIDNKKYTGWPRQRNPWTSHENQRTMPDSWSNQHNPDLHVVMKCTQMVLVIVNSLSFANYTNWSLYKLG